MPFVLENKIQSAELEANVVTDRVAFLSRFFSIQIINSYAPG